MIKKKKNESVRGGFQSTNRSARVSDDNPQHNVSGLESDDQVVFEKDEEEVETNPAVPVDVAKLKETMKAALQKEIGEFLKEYDAKDFLTPSLNLEQQLREMELPGMSVVSDKEDDVIVQPEGQDQFSGIVECGMGEKYNFGLYKENELLTKDEGLTLEQLKARLQEFGNAIREITAERCGGVAADRKKYTENMLQSMFSARKEQIGSACLNENFQAIKDTLNGKRNRIL